MLTMHLTRRLVARRLLHTTSARPAITALTMPALSPTMTEGSVTDWKVAVGESFKAGDVLLSIETDKAAIDVEAMDDGVMGKILVEGGSSGVVVGSTIALLAEEDDDITNISLPSSDPAPPTPVAAPPAPAPTPSAASTPPVAVAPAPVHALAHPTHPQPLLPSVMRLLALAKISDATIITPTGHKGMLTKGDVLAYLGKITSAKGSEANIVEHAAEVKQVQTVEKTAPKKVEVDMDGQSLRRLIAVGLGSTSSRAAKSSTSLTFDEILTDYIPRSLPSSIPTDSPVASPLKAPKDSFDSFLSM